jgi:hypothetical protein
MARNDRGETETARMAREATAGELIIGSPDQWDPDTETAYAQWREDLDHSQATGKLRVMRVPMDESGNPMLSAKGQSELFTCAVDQMTMDEVVVKVRREFMPKPMRVTAVRCMGFEKNKSGLRFNRIIVVEKGEQPETPQNSNQPSVQDLIALINAQTEAAAKRQEEFFNKLLEARTAQPAVDPMVLALGMLEKLGGIARSFMPTVTAPVSQPAGSALAQLGETLGVMKLLKDFTGSLAGASSEGDDEGGEGVAGIVKSVAGAIKPLAEGYAQSQLAKLEVIRRSAPPRATPPKLAAPAAPKPQVPASPSPAASISEAAPVAPAAPSQEETEMLDTIRAQLDNVCNLAQQGADPKEAAGLVMDLIPDKYDDHLYRLVASERFVKNLALLNKRVNEYAPWFEQLRAAMLAEFDTGEPSVPSVPGDEGEGI